MRTVRAVHQFDFRIGEINAAMDTREFAQDSGARKFTEVIYLCLFSI